jgi:hypothetical protein
MAQTDELPAFADEHNPALVSIADLITWRCKHEKHVIGSPKLVSRQIVVFSPLSGTPASTTTTSM